MINIDAFISVDSSTDQRVEMMYTDDFLQNVIQRSQRLQQKSTQLIEDSNRLQEYTHLLLLDAAAQREALNAILARTRAAAQQSRAVLAARPIKRDAP